ncbi:MAG: replication-relaxation family protein, partial [Phycisphaeraceae bacterium]
MDASHKTQSVPAIRALEVYGCLSDDQLARVTSQRPESVRKRMVKLKKAGEVLRVSHRRGGAGRPISVSCLPRSNWDTSPKREHQLQLNNVRIGFSFSVRPSTGLTIRTWDSQNLTLPPPSESSTASSSNNGKHVRPDAVVLIEHKQAKRPLVVFLELDRGTEALSRSSTKQSSWAMKAKLYQETAQLVRWRDWVRSQVSSRQEAVCRLAVVTNSTARLTSIDDTLQLNTLAVGAWLTRYDDFIDRGPWAKIWQRSGENTPRYF